MSTETKIRPHDRAESFHSAINEQNVFVFFYQGPKTLGVQSDLKHHREVSRLWQRRQRSSGGVAGTVILGGLTNNVHRVEQSCSSLWCQQNYNNHWKPDCLTYTNSRSVFDKRIHVWVFSVECRKRWSMSLGDNTVLHLLPTLGCTMEVKQANCLHVTLQFHDVWQLTFTDLQRPHCSDHDWKSAVVTSQDFFFGFSGTLMSDKRRGDWQESCDLFIPQITVSLKRQKENLLSSLN